jgi:hypothetical protein
MPLTFENLIVAGERIEPGKLIWRRYRRPAPGMAELFMDINPHLREHFMTSPYLPVGVAVILPIDSDLLQGRPKSIETTNIWGTNPAGA